jgi:hypothetical protein
MRSINWLWALTIAMLAVLAWGLEQVAFGPLQTGDIYPPFSSLRPDPLGALALYESLAALPGVKVDRLYKERQQLDSATDVLLVLGVDSVSWQSLKDETLEEYEKMVRNGGRLVIAFLPARTPGALSEKSARDKVPSGKPSIQPLPGKIPDVTSRWHIELKYRPGMDDYTSGKIPQDTALVFDTHSFAPESEWRPLVQLDGQAEAVERTFGKGTILLVADTFPLSNQGLREARDAGLITRIIGPATHITFDENHFGVVESGSIMKLMRRYRLQGAIAMLILIAALFLWRSATSLLPARDSTSPLASSKSAVAGRDSLEGLTALLHRGIAPKELLNTCFAEWSKSAPRDERATQLKTEITRSSAATPVDAYRAACRILTEKS